MSNVANTTIEETEVGTFELCNDCGAHVEVPGKLVHYKSCEPGESKKWEDFYNEENRHYG